MNLIEALTILHEELYKNPDKIGEFIDIIKPGLNPIQRKLTSVMVLPALGKIILEMKKEKNNDNKI